MPFSSGVFSLVAGNPVVTGTVISSTVHNNTLQDMANNGLSVCLLKDGTQTATADIPMGGFKFTGLGAGSAAGNSVRYEQMPARLVSPATASSSAAVDFTIDGTYDVYVVTITHLIPATDGSDLWARVSEDGGLNFKAGSIDYVHHRISLLDLASVTATGKVDGDTKVVISNALSNASGRTFDAAIAFYGSSSTSKDKLFQWKSSYIPTVATGSLVTQTGSGYYVTDQGAITAIRFMMSSGAIASGEFRLYGIVK